MYAIFGHKVKLRIAVEGNIASGKSTLLSLLTKHWSPYVSVWYESIPRTLLQLFYEHPAEYAFALQMNTLTRRAMDIQESGAHAGSIHVFDRSILGDLVFALQHRLQGNISARQWTVYQEQARSIGLFTRTLPRLDQILYLHNQAGTSHRNVKARNQVDASIPLELLEQLSVLNDCLFLAILRHGRWPVQVVDWNAFGTTATIAQVVAKPTTAHWNWKDDADAKDAKDLVDQRTPFRESAPDAIETLPPDWFPHLPAEYRHVHTASFRSAWLNQLASGQSVSIYFHPVPSLRRKTLVDWFLLDPITNSSAGPDDSCLAGFPFL